VGCDLAVLDCQAMAVSPPVQVCWLFRPDEPIARELLSLAQVLELQGLIKNWSLLDVLPGQDARAELLAHAASADVMVVFDSVPAPEWMNLALAKGEMRAVWLGVLVGVHAEAAWFTRAGIQSLPRDGAPLLGRKERQEGLLDVIRGLQEVVQLRTLDAGPATVTATVGAPEASSAALATPGSSSSPPPLQINDIFKLNGPPSVTFVEPPRFKILKHELKTMGTGLIVEGPSRVGKSTAIKKAMEALGVPARQQIWWQGSTPPSVEQLTQKLAELETAQEDTWLFIDDFHYVSEDPKFCRTLAFGMKGLADQGRSHAKVTLIGINPLGSSLVQAMPDLSGRFRIERLDVEKDWQRSTKIAELIFLGERAANLRFRRRDELVIASGGSFFLAQLLCNKAAVESGVTQRAEHIVEIEMGPEDVIAAIQKELAARYRPPLLQFASFDLQSPPRGAGLTLLWLLSRSPEGFFPVREARLRFSSLAPVFDWFLESNLSRCFRENPALQGLLYFNRAAGTLTMEDPQLKFHLRQLDWEEFALASGHGVVRFNPEDGPLWPRTIERSAAMVIEVGASTSATVVSALKTLSVLHLSDLHFSAKDHATAFYSQLHTDLRTELGVERLDALVISGDVVNRAEASEYDAARFFLEQVMKGFSLSPHQLTLTPGNHDVSWTRSKEAYKLLRKEQYRGSLASSKIFVQNDAILEERDEELYRLRLQAFAELYRTMKGREYPLDYAEQATLDEPSDGLLVLGLNSVWENDHNYPNRASIHAEALAKALLKLGQPTPEQLRIAVFHHPIHSGEESRIKDAAFLQQLSSKGFRIVLHGHVHKADAELYRYDRSEGGRQLEIVAAGTFGAPMHEWVPGYPLQYNLLRVAPDQITVETRKREEINGAWSPDARWRQGAGTDPLPRYFIKR
jgi:3',5'-cyclic AMP phosphodiesterase CpdA